MRSYNLYPSFHREATVVAEHVQDPSGKWVPTPGEGGAGAPRARKDPQTLTAGQINKELDDLDRQSSKIVDKMIAAGRGQEKPTETRRKDDPLSREYVDVLDRADRLRSEIRARYGPDAPSRLPAGRGFGPRKREAARDRMLDRMADERFLREVREHVQDPSGKWVPTPGEGGPGAAPKRPKVMAKIRGEDREVKTQADPDTGGRKILVGGQHVATAVPGRAPVMGPTRYAVGSQAMTWIRYNVSGLKALGLTDEQTERFRQPRPAKNPKVAVQRVVNDLERLG